MIIQNKIFLTFAIAFTSLIAAAFFVRPEILPQPFEGNVMSLRGKVKKAAHAFKRLVYREATEHNPAGDIVPDELDDEILDAVHKVNNSL